MGRSSRQGSHGQCPQLRPWLRSILFSCHGCGQDCPYHLTTLVFGQNVGSRGNSQGIGMKKLIVASTIVMAALYAFAGSSQSAPRYQSRGSVENARVECILPWYRFFGACDEAIQEAPDGRNWHGWRNGRRHGRFR